MWVYRSDIQPSYAYARVTAYDINADGYCAHALANETLFYYHCWVQNDYNNVWYWGRVEGTSVEGWMSADNLIEAEPDAWPSAC